MSLEHLWRKKAVFCLWLLQCSTCLLCTVTTNVQAQNDTTPTTQPPSTSLTNPSTLTTTAATTPTTAVMTTTTMPSCPDAGANMTTMIVVFAMLMFIFMLTTVILGFVLCYLCYRRGKFNKEREVRQFVFEEGVKPPELWIDPQNTTPDDKSLARQPDIWEVSTFSPSPDSKNSTMTIPDSSSSGTLQPVPIVPQTRPRLTNGRVSRSARKEVKPKRVAPPPPKSKNKKKKKANDDTGDYAVPSAYIEPISTRGPETLGKDRGGYDVPRQPKKGRWHFLRPKPDTQQYKEIDVSKIQAPNPYADLVLRQEQR